MLESVLSAKDLAVNKADILCPYGAYNHEISSQVNN